MVHTIESVHLPYLDMAPNGKQWQSSYNQQDNQAQASQRLDSVAKMFQSNFLA